MKRKNRLVLRIIKCTEIAVIALSLSAFASADLTDSGNHIGNAENNGYGLSVYDGRIAVFENEEEKPIEVFDVYVSSLPYNEQVELINGLTADNKGELQSLIEDYTS